MMQSKNNRRRPGQGQRIYTQHADGAGGQGPVHMVCWSVRQLAP